jgi:hypothetical protein
VASVTPGFKRNSTVPRVNVDIEELKKLANIDIKFYGLGLNIQSPLKYKKLPPVQATSCSEDISLLSIATWPVNRLGQGLHLPLSPCHERYRAHLSFEYYDLHFLQCIEDEN